VGKQFTFPSGPGPSSHPLPRPGASPAVTFSTGVRGIARIRTLSFFFINVQAACAAIRWPAGTRRAARSAARRTVRAGLRERGAALRQHS
jgi:hypothetical protein